ncbi:MAG: hypothetical protein JW895_15885 [Thermoleophilaceae bacterium]|nr:hypothetical protein [Thermoleophilaceae bacterium]
MGSLIRWTAILTSVIVALGFLAFAVDEIDRGSKQQQDALARGLSDLEPKASIANPSPTPAEEKAREKAHGPVREAIDDANDVLLAPFAGLVDSDNAWVNHGVPSLLALLVYGLGLGTLANMLPKGRAHGGDWRTASS